MAVRLLFRHLGDDLEILILLDIMELGKLLVIASLRSLFSVGSGAD
jgi:hypothetical protein